MQKLHALALASLLFTAAMVSTAEPFPRGELVELSTPTDMYRLARSPGLPATLIAYSGQAGTALRDALAEQAPNAPGGLFLAIELEGLLERVPGELFRDSPLPELEHGGMETIALALNTSGDRRRWTTVAGPEAELLLADPAGQANALIAFMQT